MVTILLVDDDKFILEIIKKSLESKGYVVQSAYNAIDALELAEEYDFELIISDLDMPHFNGFDLVTKLRLQEKYRTVPIMMLTAESGKGVMELGRGSGVSAWAVKPIDREKLIATVKKLLEGDKQLNESQ